ncbi:MAG: hypothetical protein WBO18_09205 [Gammaproteobacteria bacterium]
MKKRSKLDLTPEAEQGKSQAAGFSAETTPDPEPETKRTERLSASDGHQSRTSVAANPRPSRALFVMSVVVVAVAALSLYWLKRR